MSWRQISKTMRKSMTTSTRIVLPGDTNQHGTLFGGTLLSWIDMTAAIAAVRHEGAPVVTASIGNVDFLLPIQQNDIVEVMAVPGYVSNRSLVVQVLVNVDGKRAANCFATFVRQDRIVFQHDLIAEGAVDLEVARRCRVHYQDQKNRRLREKAEKEKKNEEVRTEPLPPPDPECL